MWAHIARRNAAQDAFKAARAEEARQARARKRAQGKAARAATAAVASALVAHGGPLEGDLPDTLPVRRRRQGR